MNRQLLGFNRYEVQQIIHVPAIGSGWEMDSVYDVPFSMLLPVDLYIQIKSTAFVLF